MYPRCHSGIMWAFYGRPDWPFERRISTLPRRPKGKEPSKDDVHCSTWTDIFRYHFDGAVAGYFFYYITGEEPYRLLDSNSQAFIRSHIFCFFKYNTCIISCVLFIFVHLKCPCIHTTNLSKA